jgi:hypothetical protein
MDHSEEQGVKKKDRRSFHSFGATLRSPSNTNAERMRLFRDFNLSQPLSYSGQAEILKQFLSALQVLPVFDNSDSPFGSGFFRLAIVKFFLELILTFKPTSYIAQWFCGIIVMVNTPWIVRVAVLNRKTILLVKDDALI